MFGWKSLLKSQSPLDDSETGWQPDRLAAAFPPKPSGAAAGQEGNLILTRESGASHAGRHGGSGGGAMARAAGVLQIDLAWDSSVNSAPVAFKSAAIAAASIYTADFFSNPITGHYNVGWDEAGHQIARLSDIRISLR
jgi:hypothetical protein